MVFGGRGEKETRKTLSEGLFSSDTIIIITKTQIGGKNARRYTLKVRTSIQKI